MKIAYLGQMADVATENGISKKIRTQAARWLLAGHDVRYFSLVPSTQVWSGLAPVHAELVARGDFGLRFLRSWQLTRRIRAWRPDVIYFRYAYHSPGLPQLFREIPTVAELNSDDLTEYPLTLSTSKLIYHRLTRAHLLRVVTALVPVTHELAGRFASFGKPVEVIGNSITLDDFSPLPPTELTAPVRLVFTGSAGTPWHGLDRIGTLAALFPQIGFDVIGGTLNDWQRVAPARTAPPANIVFHGVLPRRSYEPLMQRATAALGTFGLYRKRMHEACPLKVREYLAFGLPVIAAYQDTDVPPEADYFFRLPNNSAPLDSHRSKIAAWLEQWRGRRVARDAIAHFDTAEKEQRRLAFMTRFAMRSRA